MPVVSMFTQERLSSIFPSERTDAFFDALFGDAEDGAYDIRLALDTTEELPEGELRFHFELHQRPGHCLVCNLTYGLPQVFERHPVIDLKGVVSELAQIAGWNLEEVWWRIGTTESISSEFHRIPLVLLQHRK